MRHIHKLAGDIPKSAKSIHTSSTKLDAMHYVSAYSNLFKGKEHGAILERHGAFFYTINNISKKYFSQANNNTQIRAIYAGSAGLENNLGSNTAEYQEKHLEFTKECKNAAKEYEQELQDEDPENSEKICSYLLREIIKYAARGQMILLGYLNTLEDIHLACKDKYGNYVGPTYRELLAGNKDIIESANRKRSPEQLSKDMKNAQEKKKANETNENNFNPKI